MNKTRFLELLRKEKTLNAKNRSLYEVENSEYSELTSYSIALEKQIFYNNRFQYLHLVIMLSLINIVLHNAVNYNKKLTKFFRS